MTDNKEIRTLLQKFALDQCDTEEIKMLMAYLKKEGSPINFPEVGDVVAKLKRIENMDIESSDRIFDEILATRINSGIQNGTYGHKKTTPLKYSVVAAIFIGLFVISYFYRSQFNFNDKANSNAVIDSFHVQQQKSEVVTLQLQNGNIEAISEDGTSQVLDTKGNIVGKQNGNQLAYDGKTTSNELAYNTLTVPFGKKFELLLSDGSKAHLNSGTSLKYPVKFISGQERKVFLIGEAFFDVAKDSEHPFIINTGELNIRVLGTKFNVSAYVEDEVTDVVLVEGSVGMYNKIEEFDNNSFLLTPGHKGSFDKKLSNIASEEVITSLYTSWMNGELVFRNMSFENILKKMERNYNVTIINNNLKFSEEKFNASFRNTPIEKVMEYFKTAYKLDFTINGRKIIIH